VPDIDTWTLHVLAYLIFPITLDIGTSIVPSLQVWNPRHRELTEFVQGLEIRTWQKQHNICSLWLLRGIYRQLKGLSLSKCPTIFFKLKAQKGEFSFQLPQLITLSFSNK
jgi:hypothetical protein